MHNFSLALSKLQVIARINNSIVVGESIIKPSESVQNVASWFDAQMRMDVY